MRFRELLPVPRPLVAVVHLPPSPGCRGHLGTAGSRDALARDLDALGDGFDAVLLENDNDEPQMLEVDKAPVAFITRLAALAKERLGRPVGVNVQRIDWKAALAVAAAAELEFVRLDVFVDRVRMLDVPVEVEPHRVLEERARLGVEGVQLWTDVHVKHAEVESDFSIDESARRAAEQGADAILVTGVRTGVAPSIEELASVKAAVDLPVVVGSGLTSAGADALLAHADAALVGTALKREGRVDPARVREVVDAWRRAASSR
jgi:membrane complex biogenesis BtpA family protein